MNDFGGVNTGKWWLHEAVNGLHEAECPACGFCMPVAVSFDIETLKTKFSQLPVYCPKCDADMFSDKTKLYTDKETVAFGQLDPGA